MLSSFQIILLVTNPILFDSTGRHTNAKSLHMHINRPLQIGVRNVMFSVFGIRLNNIHVIHY